MAAMEGQLKKRGAKMPVMHDRYCVATWETDQALNKYVLLRSFKSQKNYLQQPGKPLSACTLKCFGDWDGKGKFRRYQHAFLMETREGQVFLCAAPSEDEKIKWLEFMSNAAPAPAQDDASASDLKQQLPSSEGTGLKLNKRLSVRFLTQALQNQASDVKTSRASSEEHDDLDDSDESDYESDVRSTTDDEFSLDEHLGLCDCAKSDELEREGSDSGSMNQDECDDDDDDDNSVECRVVDNQDSVQPQLPASNADASKVLDARPIASPAHEAHLSDLFDEEEATMPVNFVTPMAAAPKAPTVAPAQVVVEATSVPTTQASVKEASAPIAALAPAPASASSLPITRTLSAESRAALPAPTADAAAPALEPTIQQAAAPLPLPATKPEAELAEPVQPDAARAVVPEIPAPVEAAAGEASRILRVSAATADEAAPVPVISVTVAAPVVHPVENLSAPSATAVIKTETPKSTNTPNTTAVIQTETLKPTNMSTTAAPAPIAAASSPVVPTAAVPAVNIVNAAATAGPSTPTLPLAEEAGGSLSLPPVIAVRAAGTTLLEPSTLTARSPSPSQQREASATPSELGIGSSSSNNDNDDNDAGNQDNNSSSSSDGSPSPRRTRGRANSSVMPASFEPFATPTRLRRYSFSSALAPVRASHAFAIGSPIKQSFLEPHLGYVRSGLSTMVPSFPGLLTTLSRQQSVDEREEFGDDQDDDKSTDIDDVLKRLASTDALDEV